MSKAAGGKRQKTYKRCTHISPTGEKCYEHVDGHRVCDKCFKPHCGCRHRKDRYLPTGKV